MADTDVALLLVGIWGVCIVVGACLWAWFLLPALKLEDAEAFARRQAQRVQSLPQPGQVDLKSHQEHRESV